MKKSFKKKELIIKQINKNIIESISIMVVKYKDINSKIMNELHIKANKRDVKLYVIRNRLFIKAIKGTKYECLKDYIKGQIMLCFSKKNINDSLVLWKKLKLKEEKIKTLVYEGKIIKKDKIKILGNIKISDIKEILLNIINMLKIITIGKLIYILMFLIKEKKVLEK
ncbi:50S ribosomal protein L10 [Candidatus Portiera aleyrodidarum]|uniref:Large ribosomal subunit protein uL10 n=1 Tax=Candidatus Portiera aleyrodidarum TV TaxID=1297582 RepID=A0A8D4BN82_9GAMM|nr:50S ribosomal protein L10 [Candidatus Portiera aleyrodidarum]AGI27137.1 ribosomal protein L10 [Candidatus Portiera aleyrodidarum TV]CEI59109.1 50S ribosomal protein L10 [Candidatus Portiera aleyrodidarum]